MIRTLAPSLPTPFSFALGVAEKIGFYVYLLIDPRDDSIFYVGKGTRYRCFAHVEEARNTLENDIGDYAKLDRIREIESTGEAVRIDLLRHGLSESDAFLVESSVIDLLGGLTNKVDGHDATELGRMSIPEINIKYGATPVEIDGRHRVVLIRINRAFERDMTEEELYEATRKWWKVARLRRQIDVASAPQWAMAVYRGIVRAVYRIEVWEQPTGEEINIDPKHVTRWAFRGKRDLSMEETYLHRDVTSYLRDAETGNPSQNPIRYVNCSVGRHSSLGGPMNGTDTF